MPMLRQQFCRWKTRAAPGFGAMSFPPSSDPPPDGSTLSLAVVASATARRNCLVPSHAKHALPTSGRPGAFARIAVQDIP